MCQGSKNFWSAFQEEEILWEFHSDPLKTSGSFVIPREIYHEVFKEKTLFWEFHGSKEAFWVWTRDTISFPC